MGHSRTKCNRILEVLSHQRELNNSKNIHMALHFWKYSYPDTFTGPDCILHRPEMNIHKIKISTFFKFCLENFDYKPHSEYYVFKIQRLKTQLLWFRRTSNMWLHHQPHQILNTIACLLLVIMGFFVWWDWLFPVALCLLCSQTRYYSVYKFHL